DTSAGIRDVVGVPSGDVPEHAPGLVHLDLGRPVQLGVLEPLGRWLHRYVGRNLLSPRLRTAARGFCLLLPGTAPGLGNQIAPAQGAGELADVRLRAGGVLRPADGLDGVLQVADVVDGEAAVRERVAGLCCLVPRAFLDRAGRG